ncbi:TonB-dependent receptor domain-containing protein [Flavobacterium sp.]|uniref:TonB-dependent receptor domain-containing protein n=1 Tax=Flavobacterium sp. TaxID=239 RepID=UPI0039E4E5C9
MQSINEQFKNRLGKIILVFSLLCSSGVIAQERHKIAGKVLEKDNKAAIEFANVSIINTSNLPVSSTATDAKGAFELSVAPGTYVLKIDFMGFKPISIDLTVQSNQILAPIYLAPEAVELQAVQLNTEKSTIEHQLDKKVFNVGKDLVSKGGTANDLLNNVPSVSVNASGVVALRGNSAVRILINGKPSVLTANNGLEQIPSENIEKVEVITNPSARYDSEGTAGIINIVLKKNKAGGFSSSVSATTGIPDNHALGYNISYKTSKINLFSDFRYRYMTWLGYEKALRTNYLENSILDQYVDNERSNRTANIYLGGDYYINDKNTLTLSYYYRNNTGKNSVDYSFDYFDLNQMPTQLTRANERYREPQEANQIELNYVKNFENEKKKFTVNLQYDFWNDDENETVNEQQWFPTYVPRSIKSRDIESSKDFLFQSDYTVPVGQKSKVELGLKGEIRDIDSDYKVWDNGVFVDSLTNVLHYRERIFGAYVQYAGAFKKLQYLFGLRTEHADTGSDDVLGQFNIDKKYTDLFPTAHFTYSFTDDYNVQLSYSRRIQRPRFWQLNPFGGIADRRNITIGNPDLDPMYTNSYELSTLIKWKSLSINPSIYHQYSTNLFEDTYYTNPGGVLVSQQVNTGSESRWGAELSLTYNALKWLTLSGEMNYYNFEQKGIFRVSDQAFTSRINARLKHKTWSGQAGFNYQGQRNTGQTFVDAQYWMDLGIGKDLWSEKVTVTLRADNLLDSRAYKGYVSGDDYNSRFESKNKGPRVSATVTYRFNRKKNDRERQPD